MGSGIGGAVLRDLPVDIEYFGAGFDGGGQVQRDGSEWTNDVRTGNGDECGAHITPNAIAMWICDGYVSPHRQRHCQPNRNGMTNLRKYRMKHDEPGRGVGEQRAPRIIHIWQYVVEPRVRYVIDHNEKVGHGQPRQNGIGRRTYFTSRQNHRVYYVCDTSQNAHRQA